MRATEESRSVQASGLVDLLERDWRSNTTIVNMSDVSDKRRDKNKEYPMYIGIDIGGTKTAIGLGRTTGDHIEILASNRILTQAEEGPLAFFRRAVETIEQLLKEARVARESLQGIGIGCTGPVDAKKGLVMNPYTLPGWEMFDIVGNFQEEFNVPVSIDNDVNVVLLGEMALSKMHDKNVLLIMFGTGIGVACFHNGCLHTTGSTYHPEMGHNIVVDSGPACYCGNHGCMESVVSGKALNSSAEEAGFYDFEGLYQKYLQSDERAVALMEEKIRHMAAGIWNIQLVFHSDIVVLGGGIMQRHYDFFVEQLNRFLPRSPDFTGEYVFSRTYPGDLSGMVGAITLIKETSRS